MIAAARRGRVRTLRMLLRVADSPEPGRACNLFGCAMDGDVHCRMPAYAYPNAAARMTICMSVCERTHVRMRTPLQGHPAYRGGGGGVRLLPPRAAGRGRGVATAAGGMPICIFLMGAPFDVYMRNRYACT